jgi:hypothetical protein
MLLSEIFQIDQSRGFGGTMFYGGALGCQRGHQIDSRVLVFDLTRVRVILLQQFLWEGGKHDLGTIINSGKG